MADRRRLEVLASQRDASAYRILVEIADRQPAVSQQEVAEAVGITAQAVSDYVQELRERGFVRTEGRGRYEVTNEGVDWLISTTDELASFAEYVAGEVIEAIDVETALATDDVREGEAVALSMRDGVLHATPVEAAGEDGAAPTADGAGDGGATAVAVTGAAAGRDVGVAEFEGVLEHDLGDVTALRVPRVEAGGSAAVDATVVADRAAAHDVVAAAGTAALAAVRAADVTPDVRFGTVAAVEEAATKGLDVLLVVADRELSAHTDRLRSVGVSYEVLDPSDV